MADKQTSGPIQIVVGADTKEKTVIIGFNMALNRIELSPAGARDLAKQIMSRADLAQNGPLNSPFKILDRPRG